MSEITTPSGARSMAQACTNRAERFARYGDHLKAAMETERARYFEDLAALLEVSAKEEAA